MILIYTQNWDGKFKKLTYELVSYGSELAKIYKTQVVALSIGNVAEEELKKLGNYGASKVISINQEALKAFDTQVYATIINQVAEKENLKALVFAHNNMGKALAPRLSAKLKAGLVSGVESLPHIIQPFTIKKKVFTGNAYANVEVKSEKVILSLFQNSFELIETENNIEIENYTPTIPELSTKVIETHKQTGKLLLTDAEVVVAGGRGMKSGDTWQPIEKFAEILGAAVACSRPVSDEGWRPHSEHVGQTGKIIAPNVYFAFGISGAIQHLGGVSSSKCIIAINTDKDAPIFEAADYGIIADVHKVLPEMIEMAEKIKND